MWESSGWSSTWAWVHTCPPGSPGATPGNLDLNDQNPEHRPGSHAMGRAGTGHKALHIPGAGTGFLKPVLLWPQAICSSPGKGNTNQSIREGERRKEERREWCAQRWRGRWPGAHKAESPSAFPEGSSFPSLALQPPSPPDPPPPPPRSPGWDPGPVSYLEAQG